MVRDICSKYIYDKCPAVAAIGGFTWEFVPFTVKVEAGLWWFSLICSSCLFSRPRRAAAWLQPSAQCHVLAQVLRCVVLLLCVSHVGNSSSSQTSSRFRPVIAARVITWGLSTLCSAAQAAIHPLSSPLPYYPAHWSLVVSHEDGSQLADGRHWLPLDFTAQLLVTCFWLAEWRGERVDLNMI